MPSAPQAGDELGQIAIATDEKMSGHASADDGGEVGVSSGIEAIAEQFADRIAAELAGGQADGVDDDQPDGRVGRPFIMVGAGDMRAFGQPPFGVDVPW